MDGAADYTIELLRYAPGTAMPSSAPEDITRRTMLDGFGAINRAAERDLLSFKTGDLTLTFLNTDGYFDDMFALFEPADRWQLRVFRRGMIQFWGVILGRGSILFNRLETTCEVTAYGLTRQLQDTSAGTIRRTLAVTRLGAQLLAGATTATLDSTAGLLTGDVLHVTDHVNKEDPIVKQVTSGTVVSLEASAVHTFANGSEVTATTPFHRYKSVEFLVRELFTAAGIPLAHLRLSNSQFKRAAPTPVNIAGLSLSAFAYCCPAEKDRAVHVSLATGIEVGPGTYRQADPVDAWTQESASLLPFVDWSKYYRQDEPLPASTIRDLQPVLAELLVGSIQPTFCVGFDYRSATTRRYSLNAIGGVDELQVFTSANRGATWFSGTTVSAVPNGIGGTTANMGTELDLSRDLVYCYYINNDGGMEFRVYDLATAGWTDLKQADDSAKGYFGACWVPELDAVVALRASGPAGPAFEIAAFRGKARLWVRPFPSCLAVPPTADEYQVYPTHSLRHVGGSLYCVAISDGALQLIRSDDEFRTYTMSELAGATSNTRAFGARIGGRYIITGYSGAVPRTYLAAAPFYAGVVAYADFEGKSVGEALKDLAVLTNAVFWVDDSGEGRFVARDLYDPGSIMEIGDRIKTRTDSAIWDQTVQYVEVGDTVSGDNDFSATGLSLDSEFAPNEAFRQALADSYAEFYSRKRAEVECDVHDPDGHIYQPLDRVTIGGIRHMVYESDHLLPEDEVRLTLLEDA